MIGDDAVGAAFGHGLKGGEVLVHVIPACGSARIDNHFRSNDFKIIETGGARKDYTGHSRILGIDRRAAGRAEAAADNIAAVRGAVVELDLAAHAKRVLGDNNVRAMSGATRFPAIDAVAVRGQHRIGRAFVCDATTQTTPRKP